jgi:hypothetical protein
MATAISSLCSPPAPELAEPPAPTARFEWAVVGGGLWMMLGAFLDAWAHQHLRIDTFFNPWHGVLYSGMAATTAVLALTAARSHAAGRRWRCCLPRGYGLSLAAVMGFGVAGSLDLAWHSALGFEQGFDGAISPPHLMLGTCGMLAAAGPLRAAWRQPVRRAPWTAIISACLLLFLLSDLTQWAHPFNDPYALTVGPAGTAYGAQVLGLTSLILQSALLMGVVLFLLRRFTLPRGALLLLLTVAGFCMSALKDHEVFAIAAVSGGLVAEWLAAWLRPGPRRLAEVRAFAFAVPLATYAVYFGEVALLGGTWWHVPTWGGAICLTGMFGLLVSFLAFPPPAGDAGQMARPGA